MNEYKVKALRQHFTREGVYWECNLYRNGKKVAEVENRGDGGANWYFWVENCTGNYEQELKQLAAVAVPQYKGDLDMYFETLISAYEDEKEARKLARKNAA
jgi:phosphoheptose isomerase